MEAKGIKRCCICNKKIAFGNNAMPVKEGRCCDKCNLNVVVPARLKKDGGW